MKEGIVPPILYEEGEIMSQAHVGEILALKNQLIPISQNTTFHASFDNNLIGFNQGQKVSPCGYTSSLKFGSTRADYAAVYVPGLPSGASARTIECWVCPTTSGTLSTPGIIGYPFSGTQPGTPNTVFEIAYSPDGSGKFCVHVWSGTYYGSTVCATNTWHHIAAVYDGTNIYLYVNGNLDKTQAATLNTFVNTGMYNFNIRNPVNPADGARPCYISDVRVWNYARTAQQIKDSMNTELTGSESGLIGYWKLNEGQGSVIGDSSPSGSDGTIVGGTTWTEGRTVTTLRPDGKFGGAVAVEEATTNLLANPLLTDTNNDGNAESWVIGAGGAGDGSRTYNKLIKPGRYGGNIQRIEVTAVGNTQDTYFVQANIPVTADTAYTWSAYVKSNDTPRLVARFHDIGGTPIGSDFNGATYSKIGEFERLTLTATAPANSTSVNFYIRSWGQAAGEWIEIESPQMEQKSFTTSFINGSRSASKISYPKELVSVNAFTFNAWVNISAFNGASVVNTIFEIDNAFALKDRILFCYGTTQKLQLSVSNATVDDVLTSDFVPIIGKWHMVTVSFDGTNYKIYADGNLQISGNKVIATIPNNATLNIGGFWYGRLNGLIEDVRIDKVAVSDDEILAWYQSNAPFYNYLDYTGVAY